MADKEEIGAPRNPVPPYGMPEPSPWNLLYDLNATVARIDEAVSGLKERVGSVDSRIENAAKKLDTLSSEIAQIRGSIHTLKWVFGLLVPILTVLFTMLAKHFGF